MTRIVTIGWLVYRIVDGELESAGLYQTEEGAKENAAIMGADLLVKPVTFIGWGQAAPGVFSQNGKPPLRVVE
jgi:hypothetical protein